MNHRLFSAALALSMLFTCTGCALFEKEYIYSEPYAETMIRDTGDMTEIRNYSMLKAAILDMINHRELDGELRFSNYNGTVTDDLAAVCLEIRTDNSMGAYAVDTLTYDSSRIVSYYIAEIHITYKKTLEEIRSVRSVINGTELRDYLSTDVLPASLVKTAVRSYDTEMDETKIAAIIEQICFSDPVSFVIPVEATIESFPRGGKLRIFELVLDYQENPMQRTRMRETIQAGMDELLAEQLPERPENKALIIAQRLIARQDGEAGSYGSTAYGAIAERNADSRGIALAYCALCKAAGLECMVVRGSIGTMGTEEHYWNIIRIDDDYYHVDVSQLAVSPSRAFLMDDDGVWGTYIWDTEAYPACRGTLRYADVAAELRDGDAAEQQDPETMQVEEKAPADPERAEQDVQPAAANSQKAENKP